MDEDTQFAIYESGNDAANAGALADLNGEDLDEDTLMDNMMTIVGDAAGLAFGERTQYNLSLALNATDVTPAPTPYINEESGAIYILHRMPRPNGATRVFEGTIEYFSGILALGPFTLTVGLLLLSVFAVYALLEFLVGIFHALMPCIGKPKTPEEALLDQDDEMCSGTALKGACMFLLMLILIVFSYGMAAREPFLEASVNLAKASDGMGTKFVELEAYSQQLNETFVAWENTSLAGCPEMFAPYADDANQLRVDMQTTFNSLFMFTPEPQPFFDAAAWMRDDVPGIMDQMVTAIFYLVLVITCGSFGVLVLVHRLPHLTTLLITAIVALTFCLLVVVLVVVAISMPMDVMFADMCFGGVSANVIQMLQHLSGMDTEQLASVTYYLKCEGVNPMNEHILLSFQLANTMRDLSEFLVAVCPTEAAGFRHLRWKLSETTAMLSQLGEVAGCGDINAIYENLAYDLLCKSVLEGLYNMWRPLMVGGLLMYVLLFFLDDIRSKEEEMKLARKSPGFEKHESFMGKHAGQMFVGVPMPHWGNVHYAMPTWKKPQDQGQVAPLEAELGVLKSAHL